MKYQGKYGKKSKMKFKQYLTERRSHSELNPKENTLDVLRSLIGKNYIFTMTSIEKVGINPHYNFDTPLGVYFYILNEDNISNVELNMSFATDRPYITIAKVDMSKVLNIQTYNINDFNKDYKILYNLYFNKINLKYKHPRLPEDDIPWAQTVNDSGLGLAIGKTPEEQIKGLKIKFPGKNIFFLTHNIARRLFPDKSASAWERILRVDLGYWGVWDDGSGTIHPSEKSQFVAFNPRVYIIVKKLENKKNKHTIISSFDDLVKVTQNKLLFPQINCSNGNELASGIVSIIYNREKQVSNFVLYGTDSDDNTIVIFETKKFLSTINDNNIDVLLSLLEKMYGDNDKLDILGYCNGLVDNSNVSKNKIVDMVIEIFKPFKGEFNMDITVTNYLRSFKHLQSLKNDIVEKLK
jgi:hypothetical protein